MMQTHLGRAFRKALGKRYLNHRVIDDTIKALGLTNPNVIRNPT